MRWSRIIQAILIHITYLLKNIHKKLSYFIIWRHLFWVYFHTSASSSGDECKLASKEHGADDSLWCHGSSRGSPNRYSTSAAWCRSLLLFNNVQWPVIKVYCTNHKAFLAAFASVIVTGANVTLEWNTHISSEHKFDTCHLFLILVTVRQNRGNFCNKY